MYSFKTPHQWFGVTQDVILEKLVQHVEKIVLDQSFDNQLIQIVLETNDKEYYTHTRHTQIKGNLTQLRFFTKHKFKIKLTS